MSSILSSQGMVFATAMAAVSGTVILLALRLQKSFPDSQQLSLRLVNSSSLPHQTPRSCISSSSSSSSDGKKKKKKKKVHFAEDVVDPIGNSDEYRKLWSRGNPNNSPNSSSSSSSSSSSIPEESAEIITMKNDRKLKSQQQIPANRAALYNGILRDRVLHRASYSSYS